MAYCYNFKLMFFVYAMISSKHSVTCTSSSTSGSTTMTTAVQLQSTSSVKSETDTTTSSTSSSIAETSTNDETSSYQPTSVTTNVTSTYVSTTSSPSVSTAISSSSSLEPTSASTSETTGPLSSTTLTTITTSTPVPTTLTSSSTFPDNTETSDTTEFSSSTPLTETSSSTYDSTTLSMSASTGTTDSSTFESTTTSLPSSPQTTATWTSDSTTLSLSVSTTGKTSLTSETATMSSSVSEITTPLSPASPVTTAATTFKTTTMPTPPNSIVVDLGSQTLGLNFSIRVKLSFFDEYNNKTSIGFANLSAKLTEQLTTIYKSTPGFKYIQINEINGSRNIRYGEIYADEIQLLVKSNELVDANYSVIVSAATNINDIINHINDSVIADLRCLEYLDVNDINMTMQEKLKSLKTLNVCQYSTLKPCPYGFNCMNLGSGKVLCSDRCDRQVCVHGTCYIDHQNENVPKCRCPTDDDGYVYTGTRCEHKALSALIIITSAVGGAVLITAFLIICLVCIKLRRNKEQLDNIPLDNLPNYSKYFSSAFQPHYGHDLPMGSRHIIESRDLEATPTYIPDRQENTGFIYQENDNPSGDYVSGPIRDKHTYDYIGLDDKFSIRRPQLR